MTTELLKPSPAEIDPPASRRDLRHPPAAPTPLPVGPLPRSPGKRRRNRWRAASALLMIGLPVLMVSSYYGLIASDQYLSEVRFSVRGKEGPSSDALGLLAGFPATQMASDGYVVADFIKTRQLIDEVSRSIDLKAHYSRAEADWFARFDATAPIEDFVDYWKSMINIRFDPTSGIIVAGIRAFTAAESQRIAAKVLEASEALVNRLSDSARRDAVRNAEADVRRMEERLVSARGRLQEFRRQQEILDPGRSAVARQELDSRLQAELVQLRAELASLTQFVNRNAPSAAVLRAKIGSVEGELTRIRAERTPSREKAALSEVLSTFEEIEVEHQFAEKAYATALAALERARSEAERQQRFLGVYVSASLPESALYPRRLEIIALVALLSAALWGIVMLVGSTIRDHMR
jgi:capsular polysaccharide transport system permease protein